MLVGREDSVGLDYSGMYEQAFVIISPRRNSQSVFHTIPFSAHVPHQVPYSVSLYPYHTSCWRALHTAINKDY